MNRTHAPFPVEDSKPRRSSATPRSGPGTGGFTLIEVLVVVAIISALIALLLPTLSSARLRSRVVVVHSDLRHICLALDAYAMEHKDHLPPTRQSCGTNIMYQLPVELSAKRYLARSPDKLQRSYMQDPFYPGQTYRYRAPGAVWQNGILMDFPDSTWRPRANIWVPDDVPHCRSEQGQYYANRTYEQKSPVSYAVWSMGPQPNSPRFPRWEDGSLDESRLPLPREFWLTAEQPRSGLITHFRTREGLTHMSP